MGEERRKRDWPILIAVVAAILLVPIGLYVGGYFWLAKTEIGYWVPEMIPVVHRSYHSRWLAWAFKPAGRVEEFLTKHEVEIGPYE